MHLSLITKYLGVHLTQDLSWSCHINTLVKKGCQRLFYPRRLRDLKLPLRTLRNVYTCTIESVLRGSITNWMGNSTKRDQLALRRVVRPPKPAGHSHKPLQGQSKEDHQWPQTPKQWTVLPVTFREPLQTDEDQHGEDEEELLLWKGLPCTTALWTFNNIQTSGDFDFNIIWNTQIHTDICKVTFFIFLFFFYWLPLHCHIIFLKSTTTCFSFLNILLFFFLYILESLFMLCKWPKVHKNFTVIICNYMWQ